MYLNLKSCGLLEMLAKHSIMISFNKDDIGCRESPTFITSNSEEENKIKFYFLLHHCIV
jgi:hypothetical protein